MSGKKKDVEHGGQVDPDILWPADMRFMGVGFNLPLEARAGDAWQIGDVFFIYDGDEWYEIRGYDRCRPIMSVTALAQSRRMMSRRLVVESDGWPCLLQDCPPGYFLSKDTLCFKTEYSGMKLVRDTPEEKFWKMIPGKPDVYNSAGELFVGEDGIPLGEVEVQPCVCRWEELEE